MTVHNLYKQIQEQITIQGIYKATDLKSIKIVVEAFLKLLKLEISTDDYISLEKQYKISIDVIDENSQNFLVKKATYNPNTEIVTVYLYINTTERLLQDSTLIDRFEQEVYDEFVHEDTHKQQNKNSKVKFKVEDPEKDIIKYANHYTEVDAYARQTGYLLKQEFPDLEVNEIFDKIKNNKVKSEKAIDFIKSYQLPSILNRESKRFFHTLYQYLNNEED